MPWVPTTWPTTSRAVQSSHGDGLGQRSSGTPAMVAAKSSDSLR